MLKLIIGNKTYSSWSLRGWLAAKQAGLPFEEVVVSLYDEGWEARKALPDLAPSTGKVPTLWDGDDSVLWDSLAIIDYLDSLSGGTHFWPKERAALALARAMAAEMHAGYVPLRQACGMNLRHVLPAAPLSAEVAADITRILHLWSETHTRFGEGAFLFGDFGAVDIMFAPVITRFVTYSIPVPPFARAYMDAVLDHPFMREWIAAAKAEPWVIPRLEPVGQA